MEFQLDQAIEILAGTPAVLAALLGGKSDAWLRCRECPDTFSPLDVLGHLIHGEQTDWIPRARIILECGESRPFDSFDRRGFGPVAADQPVEGLLRLFEDLRKKNLASLAGMDLDREKLALKGIHPELGQVNLEQLLATWVVHDLGHFAQIARVLSRQYSDAVGPWRQYLSIVR